MPKTEDIIKPREYLSLFVSSLVYKDRMERFLDRTIRSDIISPEISKTADRFQRKYNRLLIYNCASVATTFWGATAGLVSIANK
jgi:hypothetical protein